MSTQEVQSTIMSCVLCELCLFSAVASMKKLSMKAMWQLADMTGGIDQATVLALTEDLRAAYNIWVTMGVISRQVIGISISMCNGGMRALCHNLRI